MRFIIVLDMLSYFDILSFLRSCDLNIISSRELWHSSLPDRHPEFAARNLASGIHIVVILEGVLSQRVPCPPPTWQLV